MKAIVFDQPGDEDVLELREVDRPELPPGFVRIRVHAAGVNRGDLLQRRGMYPPPPGASEIIGLECAGEVVETGEGVSRWKKGDRVMALLPGGGYAEEAVAHEGSCLAVPGDFTDDEAGGFPEVFLTAFLNVFQYGRPPERGSVLIHGGGSGVGTAAITLCKEAGLRVFVTAGSDGKCGRCEKHGADRAVNYREQDFAKEVKEATGGDGVDVVLDCIGGSYLERNLDVLRTGGRLVVIGLLGGMKAEINLATLLLKRLQVIGSTLRARPVEEKAGIIRAFEDRFDEALRSGRIRPVVDRTFPLADAADAHRLIQSSAHFGKVVLRTS